MQNLKGEMKNDLNDCSSTSYKHKVCQAEPAESSGDKAFVTIHQIFFVPFSF